MRERTFSIKENVTSFVGQTKKESVTLIGFKFPIERFAKHAKI